MWTRSSNTLVSSRPSQGTTPGPTGRYETRETGSTDRLFYDGEDPRHDEVFSLFSPGDTSVTAHCMDSNGPFGPDPLRTLDVTGHF